MKTKTEDANQYVLEGEELHYWYSLDLITVGPRSVTDQVIAEAKAKIPPGTVFQHPKELHCTMFYNHYQGPDTLCERTRTNLYWDKQKRLQLQRNYSNQTDTCSTALMFHA